MPIGLRRLRVAAGRARPLEPWPRNASTTLDVFGLATAKQGFEPPPKNPTKGAGDGRVYTCWLRSLKQLDAAAIAPPTKTASFWRHAALTTRGWGRAVAGPDSSAAPAERVPSRQSITVSNSRSSC